MSGVLSNFLFGNIDDDGNLEDSSYLTAEVRDSLGNVAALGQLSREISAPAGPQDQGAGPSSYSGGVQALSSAKDFTEIDELAEDNTPQFKVPEVPKEKVIKEPAGMEGLSNVEKAKLLFPEFDPNKKLRFSRLFGNSFSGRALDRDWKYGKKKKKYKRVPKPNGLWTKATLPPAPVPPPHMLAESDQDKILAVDVKPEQDDPTMVQEPENKKNKDNIWRNGPAVLWYDIMNLPQNMTGYDYGFKMAKVEDIEAAVEEEPEVPELPYLMMDHVQWEDAVIWDNKHMAPPPAKHMDLLRYSKKSSHYPGLEESLLEPTNRKLLSSEWENNVIWDTKNMKHILTTPQMVIDPVSLLKVPIEKEKIFDEEKDVITPRKRVKSDTSFTTHFIIPHCELQRLPFDLYTSLTAPELCVTKAEYPSKMRIKPQISSLHPIHGDHFADKTPKILDPYNLSSEEHYQPKPTSIENVTKNNKSVIQHSIPALELELEYFPTYMKPEELRRLHRPFLKSMRSGPHSKPIFKPVFSLERYVGKKERDREQERLASGGGQVFYMRTKEDLSCKDGRIVLFEYSEEHPLLMGCSGMASRIKNYSKKNANGEPVMCNMKYGEQIYGHSPYFLGQVKAGETLQVTDCNMYVAPTYQHRLPSTDFILARTSKSFFIRMTDDIFCVGQEFPKIVVPGPNSKRANEHTRSFLQVFIYRLFLESDDIPRRIKMDNIKAAFPAYSESSIRKRLKNCADFKRTGSDCGWWVLQEGFRLPSEEEIRSLVLPEDCCAFYSMQYAEQRLKDSGYGKAIRMVSDDEDEDDTEKILEDEVRIAPWHLTRAFRSALNGKCQLEISGISDPTGTGEGYSYLRVANKPSALKQKEQKIAQKEALRIAVGGKEGEDSKGRTVMGTDSDLRRLTLKKARDVLRGFKIPEEKINSLSRWDVINLVRQLSTEAARSGDTNGMDKFARGTRYSLAEHQEKYKDECQKIFDLQNKVLSSVEVLSTDDEESSDEDNEELGKDLESMLNKKKTLEQLSMEKEEAERKDLRKLLDNQPATPGSEKEAEPDYSCMTGKKLLIHRKFATESSTYVRTEVISRPEVIDAYLKITSCADKSNRRNLIDNLDEEQKDEVRKERRRLQEQLRRLNRAQERERANEKKLRKMKDKAPINMKCGACGDTGHMRTNKHCRMYGKAGGAMSEDQLIDNELSTIFNENSASLVKVEDTKIRIGRALLAQVDDAHQKAMIRKEEQKKLMEQSMEAKEAKAERKRKRLEKAGRKGEKLPKTPKLPKCFKYEDLDYLEPKVKGVNRARVHPDVELRAFFEDTISKIKDVPGTGAFHKPVSAKGVPDYYKFVSNPMDLQTMNNHCKNNFYQAREDFLEHLDQIVKNSKIYNGVLSPYSQAADSMMNLCKDMFAKNEQRLQHLEEQINPAANKSTQNQFNLILLGSVNSMVKVPHSMAFHIPVNAKCAPDYYQIISTPMDLSSLKRNIEKNKYKNRTEFVKDVNLIHENSKQYNTVESKYTIKAQELLEKCKEVLQQSTDMLTQYEGLLSFENNEVLLEAPLSPSESHTSAAHDLGLEESDEEPFLPSSIEQLDSMTGGPSEEAGHTLLDDLMDSEDDSDDMLDIN